MWSWRARPVTARTVCRVHGAVAPAAHECFDQLYQSKEKIMNEPESIATQLWSERAAFTNLKDDEFVSQSELLNDVKKELRAIGSFKDLDSARAYYKALNDEE
jgi:hypothetical protein